MTPEPKKPGEGTFIVIEGTDGVGKSTQYDLLCKKLQDDGHDILKIHFPKYEDESSFFVRNYLAGKYGSADEIGPYTGSLFYALDRYHASLEIRKAIDEGKTVICDRFTGSNMAHQGTKFADSAQRRGYFIWLDNLEFEMLKIPRPDKSIVLTAPYEIIAKRLKSKIDSSTHVSGKDVHEIDPEHGMKSLEVFNEICQLFPKDFTRIDCMRDSEILDINTVHRLIYQTIEPLLPRVKTNKNVIKNDAVQPPKSVTSEENDFVKTVDGLLQMTKSGEEYLNDAITSTTDNVYAFTDKMDPLTIAAAMARLSRRGDDMRITILDEFSKAGAKDAKLLQRVITAYGDDSVQQLVGQHFVIEGASNLLTKKLEWGRLASYLEQSTRYIYFDKKDSDGKYKYYTPENFDKKTKKTYESAMDNIFGLYSELVHKLTDYVRNNSSEPKDKRDVAWQGATRAQACDAARPVLPVSTKSTVGIYASGQAVESLVMHLLGDELSESKITGQKILDHCRKTIPTFLERADKADRGGATIAYNATTKSNMKKISEKYMSNNNSEETENVTLVSYWPKNELDLLPDMIYPHSNQSLRSLTAQTNSLSIDKKAEIFKTYVGERLNRRHKPGRAIEKAHYSWDLMCDYGIFRDLQRHRMVDDLDWQILTPRYGYEMPKLVEDAGLEDLFDECFDISLKLHSQLQSAGYELETQYATLLGHKMRWKITYNAREAFHLHELRTSPQGHPGYRKLVLEMHEKLAEVHPLMAQSMIFVNKGEDEELTRLAAERYTQFKLNQI